MTLHVIRMDMLLHALGGFEERRDFPRERGSKASYTDFQISQIKKLAAKKLSRGRYGAEVLEAAKRLDIPYHSLRALIPMIRRGAAPKVWSYVA